jgi:carbamoyl-phosphate synthase large subunit
VTRVLVTGAGGAAGVAVIRDLARAGHRVVAIDADPDAAGLRLAPTGAVIPTVTEVEFGSALLRVVDEHRPQVLLTTIAEEIAALHDLAGPLVARGVACWLPSQDAAAVCLDKWKFAQVLADAGVPTPPTGLGDASAIPGPWVVKPRFGRGSRDVHLVEDAQELTWACRRTPEPIVQTRISGREYTADVLVDHDGTVAACVPRWRLATKAGISTRGETFESSAVADVVARTVAAVGVTGPLNLQGFVHGDAATVIEVNPRFSGGLPLSLAAGADLVGEAVRGALGEPLRSERLQYRPGVRMIRYYDEVFEG